MIKEIASKDDAGKSVLNTGWINRLIKLAVNRWEKATVSLPPNSGSASFQLSEETVVLDLSKMVFPDNGGTHVEPYEMEWGLEFPDDMDAKTDTWDIDSPPPDTDGVTWKGPRSVRTSVLQSAIDDYLFLYFGKKFSRELTYDSAGRIVAISEEFVMEKDTWYISPEFL